jgi:hypothetical protein
MQQWIYHHPWAITGFMLGIGIGILICLPLLPYTLPDSSAQLIGSFLGAGIAVTGAIWITTNKERQFRADLRLAAIVIYEPFMNSLAERMAGLFLLDGQTTPLDQIAMESMEFGRNLSKVTRPSFEDLRPAFASTPNDIIIHRLLLGAMDRFIAFFDAEVERDESRSIRHQQYRQSVLNRHDLLKTSPQPVKMQGLLEAIDNAKSVMDTVGR